MSKRPATEQEKARLQKIFLDDPYFPPPAPCDDCRGYHLRACPRVRREVRIGAGTGEGRRTEVEYWERWDDSEVFYPEDVFDPDDIFEGKAGDDDEQQAPDMGYIHPGG